MASDDIRIPPQIRLEDMKLWIISQLDIGRFYQSYLPPGTPELRQVSGDGWSNRILCPFHNDANNAAFFVNLKTGGYNCQTCHVHGSAFDFWMHKNGMSIDKSNLNKALVGVANAAGVDLHRYLGQHRSEISSGKLPPELDATKTMAHLEAQQPKKRVSTDELDLQEKPIPKEILRHCTMALRSEHIRFLVMARGLTKKTIEERQIGWMEDTPKYQHKETGEWVRGRYAFPVFDREGNLRNIRLYSPSCDPSFKVLNYKVDAGLPTEKAYGKPCRLTNVQKLFSGKYIHIVITEGELDEMLLNQKFEEGGYQTWLAMSGTHGTTFMEEWVDWFVQFGVHIYLCQDCDETGKLHAKNILTDYFLPILSSGKLPSVRNVVLPLTGEKDANGSDKDISDYFLRHKEHTVDDFVKLCLSSEQVIAGGVDADDASIEPMVVDDLNALIRDRRFIDQRVKVPLTIVSVAEQTYHAVRSCVVDKCPLKEKGECCQNPEKETKIPYGHPLFIASCMEREESVLQRLRSIVCTKEIERIKIVPKSKVVMELYYAHQLTDRTRQGDEGDKSVLETTMSELAHVQVYLLQSQIPLNVEPKGYSATGWVRTNPKTSTVSLFIEKMTPIEEDWRRFTLKDSLSRSLIKQLHNTSGVLTTEEILEEITQGVTRIFDADEILLAILLMFLSPLRFFFNGSTLRGWINIIIIGDSGVGKSATYTRFSDWVEVGSWFSALTGSRTGLLYATKQKGNEWYIAAGDYVQASGKALAVDETQVLEREVTRSLGNAMDTGRLEVKRVASATYPAKTRCAFLMNAIRPNGEQATLSDFTYGCEALMVSFDPMFIRRMDLAIFCPQQPNREDRYNRFVDARIEKTTTTKLSALMMRSLIYWAWTREAHQIEFTEEATKTCLQLATNLSRIYGAVDKVPLINPNDFRENLARLSVAFAILERNFSEDLERVIVLPIHVQKIAAFVDKVYSEPACGLRQFSEETARINRMDEVEFKRLQENILRFLEEDLSSNQEYYRTTYPTLRILVYAKTTKQFTLREIMEVTGLTMGWLRRRVDHFKCLDLIVDAERGLFRTTRKFNLFMMRWRQEQGVEEKLEMAKNRMFYAAPQEPKEQKEKKESGNSATNPPRKRKKNPDDPFGSDPFEDELASDI